MTFPSFTLAVLALLVVPGPTNTLLAASGAAVRFRKSLVLLPMELAGYLIAIGIWGHVVGPLAATYSLFPLASKLVASAYLAWSAIKLFRNAHTSWANGVPPAPPRQLFITTLLNPKALIFALVIFPQTSLAEQLPYAALFSGMVLCIGALWVWIGTLIVQSARGAPAPALVARLAAVALGIFAALLAGSVVSATVG